MGFINNGMIYASIKLFYRGEGPEMEGWWFEIAFQAMLFLPWLFFKDVKTVWSILLHFRTIYFIIQKKMMQLRCFYTEQCIHTHHNCHWSGCREIWFILCHGLRNPSTWVKLKRSGGSFYRKWVSLSTQFSFSPQWLNIYINSAVKLSSASVLYNKTAA